MEQTQGSRKRIAKILSEIGDKGLIDLYSENVRACTDLEKKYGISRMTFYRRLVKLGVKIRSNAESKRGIAVWNQGKGCINYAGYRVITMDGKQVMEHRVIMEKHLGRKLTSLEVIHHINEIRTDNRIENLEVISSHSDHMKLHFNSEIGRERGAKGLITVLENRRKRRILKYGSGDARRVNRRNNISSSKT